MSQGVVVTRKTNAPAPAIGACRRVRHEPSYRVVRYPTRRRTPRARVALSRSVGPARIVIDIHNVTHLVCRNRLHVECAGRTDAERFVRAESDSPRLIGRGVRVRPARERDPCGATRATERA